MCAAENYSDGLSYNGEGLWRIHFRKSLNYFRFGVNLESSLNVSVNHRGSFA